MIRKLVRRRVVLVALALPLLNPGTCVTIAQESLLEGVFDGITAQAALAFQEQLAEQFATSGTAD